MAEFSLSTSPLNNPPRGPFFVDEPDDDTIFDRQPALTGLSYYLSKATSNQ